MWLNCDGVTLIRSGAPLFSDLGFTLFGHGGWVLAGRNGAGKTSLLKIIMGMVTPDRGTISTSEGARMAYMDPLAGLKPTLTVGEQLAHVARLAQTELLLAPSMHYFRLGEHADLPCGMLSSGWQKRVLLAQLMLMNATVWLLDEPEVHLDADALERLIHLVRTRVADGGMVLWATHHTEVQRLFPVLLLEDFA